MFSATPVKIQHEVSLRAGIAGHYQWGLDAGDHQDDWDPYAGIPEHWNHNDRDGSDTELERGPQYVIVKRPAPVSEKRTRPQPRPLGKKKT
ncbi:hypothetical protein LshimejAT787_2200180 [Lyophyllum shimeji]|uniref:Uncharacterized protein n=1 Tax=Lyophyllum shimeji TaxID=47721 RepID=A0A9P3UV14_LYOSH|nr:hypothetical protein LshimejAT787_2200180 [Lyophyllum shimeji]